MINVNMGIAKQYAEPELLMRTRTGNCSIGGKFYKVGKSREFVYWFLIRFS